jgi:hypothetical protein
MIRVPLLKTAFSKNLRDADKLKTPTKIPVFHFQQNENSPHISLPHAKRELLDVRYMHLHCACHTTIIGQRLARFNSMSCKISARLPYAGFPALVSNWT